MIEEKHFSQRWGRRRGEREGVLIFSCWKTKKLIFFNRFLMRADRRSDWESKTLCLFFVIELNLFLSREEKFSEDGGRERENFSRWREKTFFLSRWSSAEKSFSSDRIDSDDKQISPSKWLSCVDDHSPSPRYHFDSTTTTTTTTTEEKRERREAFSSRLSSLFDLIWNRWISSEDKFIRGRRRRRRRKEKRGRRNDTIRLSACFLSLCVWTSSPSV